MRNLLVLGFLVACGGGKEDTEDPAETDDTETDPAWRDGDP